MGEKLYKPIYDENEKHLVQSRENPGRVRGQTRDKDNKNPDIIEWEPVEVPEYEYELEKLAHNERLAETQERQSVADIVTLILKQINTIVTFIGENPEIVDATVRVGKSAKQNIANKKTN